MPLIFKIALLLVLILVNAFFAMSEIAVVSMSEMKIKKLADADNKKAKKLLKLTFDSAGFLATIQVGVTLAGFLTSASASQNFADMLNGSISNLIGVTTATGQSVVRGVSVVIITLITSYFSLVLGELVPKQIALRYSEQIALRVSGFLLGFKKVMKPIVFVLTKSTNLVTRIFRIKPQDGNDTVTEEDILMMVDAGEEVGAIEESQADMINKIFEFDDIDVGDVMRHRTEVSAIEITASLQEAVNTAIEEGYSRIPVFEDDLDNIVGILYVKDLLRFVGRMVPKGAALRDIMRPAYHVPEYKRCGELFKEMTEKRIQMAVVVDEYGGTAGIVTLEDLLESIVGSIQDEYDDEEEDIKVVNENTFTIDGTCDIDEVEDMLDTKLPDGDYDTLGGMIMSIIGRIPKNGEQPFVEVAGFKFTVLNVEEKRIGSVRAERQPLPENINN